MSIFSKLLLLSFFCCVRVESCEDAPTNTTEEVSVSLVAASDMREAVLREHIEYRLERNFRQRFGALAHMEWYFLTDHQEDNFEKRYHNKQTRRFSNNLIDVLSEGSREWFVETPAFSWGEDFGERALDALPLFRGLRDSIAGVDEEEINTTVFSLAPAERSWFSSLQHSDVVRYGVRPFRTSPYGFVSVGFSDPDIEQKIALHLRIYAERFARQRMEAVASVQLTSSWEVAGAMSYEPKRDTQDKGPLAFSVRLQKIFASPESAFVIGARFGREQMVMLLFTKEL